MTTERTPLALILNAKRVLMAGSPAEIVVAALQLKELEEHVGADVAAANRGNVLRVGLEELLALARNGEELSQGICQFGSQHVNPRRTTVWSG